MDRKPDADAIAAFLDRLAREPWLEHEQRDWPRFLFHVTHARNAASILHTGMLSSRREAIHRGLLANDQAAKSVIAETSLAHQACARRYFRPWGRRRGRTRASAIRATLTTPAPTARPPWRSRSTRRTS